MPIDASGSATLTVFGAVMCVVLAGIPEGAAYVHVMYIYRDPSDNMPYDDSFEVNFKLPVREED